MTSADAKPLTAEQIERFRNIRDEDIDFSDNPEATPEDYATGRVRVVSRGGVRVGAGRKPVGTKPVTLWLRETTIAKIRDTAQRQNATQSAVVEAHLAW
jgi:hypothetical protein